MDRFLNWHITWPTIFVRLVKISPPSRPSAENTQIKISLFRLIIGPGALNSNGGVLADSDGRRKIVITTARHMRAD